MTERDGPMTPKAFHALFGRIGARAKMQFPIHPHMLRHGCGYALTFSTRSATPSWLLIGLSTSGAENLSSRCRLEPAPCGRNRNACDHVRASSMIAVMLSLSGSWRKMPRRRPDDTRRSGSLRSSPTRQLQHFDDRNTGGEPIVRRRLE